MSEKLFALLERAALYVLVAAVALLVAISLLLVLEFVRVVVR